MKKDTLLHEDICRYEGVLSNARSSVDFSLGSGIYMLPSDLHLKVAIKKEFSDKLKAGKTDQAGIAIPKKSALRKRQGAGGIGTLLTLREQRLSSDQQDELQSLVLLGYLAAVGVVYFLKTR